MLSYFRVIHSTFKMVILKMISPCMKWERLVTKDARKIVTNLNMAEPNYTNWDRILIYSSEQIIKSQKMETKEHPIKTGYWNLVQLNPTPQTQVSKTQPTQPCTPNGFGNPKLQEYNQSTPWVPKSQGSWFRTRIPNGLTKVKIPFWEIEWRAAT